ncbi:MAG TPA: cytochrome c oxidase subunit 4 [Acidimicrobiales bacterium]|nr:cytochrome c oxidase subunit 4 [Acidimicrobiales bacterium]
MKHEWHLALGTAVFLAAVGIAYWIWSGETSGTVMLIFGGFAYSLLFGFMFLVWLRRKGRPRVEDRDDAMPADGEGEIGFFPSNSIWPVAMGLGAISMAVGLAFGKWFWAIGGILLLGSIIGFAVEAESH